MERSKFFFIADSAVEFQDFLSVELFRYVNPIHPKRISYRLTNCIWIVFNLAVACVGYLVFA